MCSIVYIKCVTESERVTERVRELVVARSSFLVSAVPAGNIKNRKARTAVAIIVVVVLYKRVYYASCTTRNGARGGERSRNDVMTPVR